MSQLEEQCEVSYWKEDAPVTREALMDGVKVTSFSFFQDDILDEQLVVSWMMIFIFKQLDSPDETSNQPFSGKRSSLVFVSVE